MATVIKLKRRTIDSEVDPILSDGEPLYDKRSHMLYISDADGTPLSHLRGIVAESAKGLVSSSVGAIPYQTGDSNTPTAFLRKPSTPNTHILTQSSESGSLQWADISTIRVSYANEAGSASFAQDAGTAAVATNAETASYASSLMSGLPHSIPYQYQAGRTTFIDAPSGAASKYVLSYNNGASKKLEWIDAASIGGGSGGTPTLALNVYSASNKVASDISANYNTSYPAVAVNDAENRTRFTTPFGHDDVHGKPVGNFALCYYSTDSSVEKNMVYWKEIYENSSQVLSNTAYNDLLPTVTTAWAKIHITQPSGGSDYTGNYTISIYREGTTFYLKLLNDVNNHYILIPVSLQ